MAKLEITEQGIKEAAREISEFVEQRRSHGTHWRERIIFPTPDEYSEIIARHCEAASPTAPTKELDYDILLQAADHLSQLGGGPMEDRLRLLHAGLSAIPAAPTANKDR